VQCVHLHTYHCASSTRAVVKLAYAYIFKNTRTIACLCCDELIASLTHYDTTHTLYHAHAAQGPVAVVVTEPAVTAGGALYVQQPGQSQLVAPVTPRTTVATGATVDSGRSSEQTREALRFLFGKEGEFLREFLLDEASVTRHSSNRYDVYDGIFFACHYCCFSLRVLACCHTTLVHAVPASH
jgi:hypothetical protein